MEYKFGKYKFYSEKEYEAARRDARKIAGLKRTGRSTAEISRNYKQQLKEQHITFESVVGDDFREELDRRLFLEPAGSTEREYEPEPSVRRVYVSPGARRLSALKVGTITAFTISLGIVVYALIAQVWRDFRSSEQLQTLSHIVEDQTPSGANIVAAAELTEPVEELPAEEVPLQRVIMPKYQALAERNSDFVGWMKIPDTIIDYPVMYLPDDNDFYLAHNFDKAEDVNGLLVLDKRCNADASGTNILIHGHNMDSGAIFGTLYLYRDYAYWENHSKIYFDSLYEERTYEIIAVFVSSVYNSNANEFAYYDYINIESEDDFNTYVRTAKDLSLYDTGKTAVYGDELITLSTCEYSRENGRLVILGRRLR
ncbi:MAG: class B sortase [Lachnospiraceae bacterium]|nr:class B sortase [Lachnospiraceae bacterium]